MWIEFKKKKKKTYRRTVCRATGLLRLLIFVFGCQGDAVCVVQILHEPEEGEFIEEDLGDLHQKILPAVLQSTAHEFTKRVLERRKASSFSISNNSTCVTRPSWCCHRRTCSMPPNCRWKKRTNSLLSSFCWVRVSTMRRTEVNSWREHTSSMFS